MAEQENILTRLGKLFQSNIVVRKTDSGQIKVKDLNLSQNTEVFDTPLNFHFSSFKGTSIFKTYNC